MDDAVKRKPARRRARRVEPSWVDAAGASSRGGELQASASQSAADVLDETGPAPPASPARPKVVARPPGRMMRQYELVERVRRYNPHADEALLDRAYVYAMKAHGTQLRASGDPYISHPLEVAAILTDLKLDDATIVAGVLHDVIEDTSATREEIERLFGGEIARLVDGLTKIKRLDLVSKTAAQGENVRKLLLAIAEDVRVLLVKLADRLHNMRTLDHVPPEKRKRVAQETLDIYAPLAGRMGMQGLRDELEELSFRHSMPEAYDALTRKLADTSEKSAVVITAIETELKDRLAAKGVVALVKARQKRPYSIWKKMERKSLAFEQLSDILGFRVIVDSTSACYKVLGVVHTTWSSVPGRFKDYISTPKQNDYRSIHTTIVGPGSERVELQIRSRDMDRVADYGIAAHALYKDRANGEGGAARPSRLETESRAYRWLRQTVEALAEGDSPEDFLENTKLELFHDQVFCFTPKGKIIALPRGATPIDFAYAVHTDVGDSAVGAKINGRLAPLVSELNNGDEVEVLRAQGQTPPAAWEAVAVTGKARSAIRRATRSAVRQQYAGLGRQILERAFERAGRHYGEDKLRAALPRLARHAVEDVLAAVGRGEMFSGDVVRAVYPDFKESRFTGPEADRREGGWFEMKTAEHLIFKVPGAVEAGGKGEDGAGQSLPIRGLQGDLPIRFAPESGAVPGDRIVGILTPGEGITVYPIHARALSSFDNEPERWLDVRWDLDAARHERFPARICVTCIHEPGTLAEIAQVIGEQDANIEGVAIEGQSPDFRQMTIDLGVFDLKHLNSILTVIRTRPRVSRAERLDG